MFEQVLWNIFEKSGDVEAYLAWKDFEEYSEIKPSTQEKGTVYGEDHHSEGHYHWGDAHGGTG